MKLSINLKSLRIDHDLTQKVLAEKIGISRERYSNYEQGIRTPDYEILKALANLYNISLDELFGYEKKNIKKSIYMNFHNNLRKLRQEKDLSQTALANELNLVQSTYHRYEIGSREPDINTIIKLAKYYNISLDELFGYEKKGGQTFDQEKLIFKTKMHEELFQQINLLSETQLSIVKDIINSLLKTNQSERKESV